MAAFTKTWTELSGENHWENMLETLDEDLRTYLIHYGERSQAIGDAFNGETVSPYYGQSRYTMENLFTNVGLDNSPFKYEVTMYIFYQKIWIGYVAVATDDGVTQLGRRDILVAWRGTMTLTEATKDYDDTLVPDAEILNGAGSDAMVHKGWDEIYSDKKDGVKDQVRAHVKEQVDKYKNETISITVAGHSMGAALATLNAIDLYSNSYNIPTGQTEGCLVTVFAYASPKVGNEPFKAFFNNQDKLRCLRITNAIDYVPQLPPIRYYHVGDQLMVDSRQSPYLKSIILAGIGGYIVIAHQLEVYLHLVANTKGIDGGKFYGTKRLELVNKGGDYLGPITETVKHIPAAWWVVEKKAMVQLEDGSWVLEDAPKISSK